MPTFVPAPTSMPRVCRFIDLLDQLAEGVQPAASPEPSVQVATANYVEPSDTSLPGALRYDDLFQHVIRGQRYAEIATLIVVVDEDGETRDLTKAEATSDHFDSAVFAEGWKVFWLAMGKLVNSLRLVDTGAASAMLQEAAIKALEKQNRNLLAFSSPSSSAAQA
ncbi:MAG: hypothetical protein AAGN64_01800 [Bacteroidota bacterium]